MSPGPGRLRKKSTEYAICEECGETITPGDDLIWSVPLLSWIHERHLT